jgi:hypothetical protein
MYGTTQDPELGTPLVENCRYEHEWHLEKRKSEFPPPLDVSDYFSKPRSGTSLGSYAFTDDTIVYSKQHTVDSGTSVTIIRILDTKTLKWLPPRTVHPPKVHAETVQPDLSGNHLCYFTSSGVDLLDLRQVLFQWNSIWGSSLPSEIFGTVVFHRYLTKDKAYLFPGFSGGSIGKGAIYYYDKLHVFDFNSKSFNTISCSGDIPIWREGPFGEIIGVTNDILVVFGNGPGMQLLRVCHVLHVTTGRWRKIPVDKELESRKRCLYPYGAWNRHIVIYGDARIGDTVWTLDTDRVLSLFFA